LIVDANFVYALLDRRDRHHAAAAEWFEHADEDIATTPLVLAEIDYMAGARLGRAARSAFRSDLGVGAYVVAWWPEATRQAVHVAEQYRDLDVTLADASLVALAARLATTRIATFDERHFRAMQPLSGGAAFTLLPADD
jgi:hypothetical protein